MSASASAARPRSILVVHPALPTHDMDAGSLRLRWIVELLVAEGHRVTFLGHSGWAQDHRYADELRDLGVEVHRYNGRWWREQRGARVPGPGIDLDGLLHRGRFDLAWLSTYEMGEFYAPSIRRASPATRVLIDSVDVHHVRERRGAALTGDPAAFEAAERTRLRERAVYSAADALVAVSAVDAEAMSELAPDVPVSVVSTVHALPASGPDVSARDGLVFVGGFDHQPNVGAMVDFVGGPWPSIAAALPGVALTIVGSNPPPVVQALGATPGVTVTGWVPETAPYLDAARVSIAPLRYGAGVKGKVGEAMSHGLPVVTTSVGAEGMGLVDGQTALIADTDEAFAAAVARVYEDRGLWERLAAAGRAHVERTHGLEATRAALRDTLRSTIRGAFVATDAWSDPAALTATLQGYLRAFGADDPVSLVLGIPPAGPEPEAAAQRAMDALATLGADPEQIPDVMIVPATDHVPVPTGGARVGATGRREAPVAVLAPDDGPEAWHAALADVPRSPSDTPVASVVICTYGQRAYTERCLASLERALGPKLGTEVELVLVDNASPDDTAELLKRWEDRARVLLLPVNRNFAGGNNAGAAVARGQVLIFLNNDTEVPAGVIEGLAGEALRPEVGLVGLRLRYPDGLLQHAGFAWREVDGRHVPFHLFHHEDGELPAARATFDTSGVTGACVAIRAELFDAVGGFDEAYINGWEDTDLVQRVRAAGARVRYRGDLEVLHHEGATTGRDYARTNRGAVDNQQIFAARWGDTLEGDEALLERQLGARIGPLTGTIDSVPGGAEVLVLGHVAGLGAAGVDARGLLADLAACGLPAAARTPAATCLRPALGAAEDALVDDALARPQSPDATLFVLAGSEPAMGIIQGSRMILRLATVPAERHEGALAWAATPALAAELVAAGWPREAVLDLPPCGIPAAGGDGGDGVLAFVPDHDAEATDALFAALRDVDGPVALMPVARTPELALRVATELPGATLLHPDHDESRLAQLAARADVVVAVDPADPYDRRALIGAGAGAAVMVLAGGPAEAVLGRLHAATVGRTDVVGLARAIAAADTSPEARAARTALVAAACTPQRIADALRAISAASVPA
ncbi:MAG TPA: glycosyltransferase [Baekduia sp.]|jgi:GT2 family glycosyltransferase/glycosyltransferase involved in cell wall biosynthesis